MKKLLLALFCISLAGMSFAQSGAPEEKAAAAAQALSEKFQLSAAQQEKMHKIQLRRYRDLALVAPNKASDQQLYLEQLIAIEEGTGVSIQLMLSEAQLAKYQEYAREVRMKRAAIGNAMMEQGLPAQQIQVAMWEME
jgi:parvulin-like peptidyl-prolyl isomerase